MDNVKRLHKHYYYQVDKYTGESRHCVIPDKDFKCFKSGTMGCLAKDSSFSVYVAGKIEPVYTGIEATFYTYKDFIDSKYYLIDNVFYLVVAVTQHHNVVKGYYDEDDDSFAYLATKSNLSYPKPKS